MKPALILIMAFLFASCAESRIRTTTRASKSDDSTKKTRSAHYESEEYILRKGVSFEKELKLSNTGQTIDEFRPGGEGILEVNSKYESSKFLSHTIGSVPLPLQTIFFRLGGR